MKLNNIDLSLFIPQFMREDKTTQAFVYAITAELNSIIDDIQQASIYSRIDELSEELLDILADQFNIVEYNISYELQAKRNLIKNCMLLHHQRGTVGAVKRAVIDVFGEGRIEEWFTYGGEPFHFKVYTSNSSATDEMLKDFERLINSTQNCRSYLESAVIELFHLMEVNVCGVLTTSTVDKFYCE